MLTNATMTNRQKIGQTIDRHTPGRGQAGAQAQAQNGAMTTNVAQQRISRDLLDAEAALDEALLRQSRLLSTMVSARRETGSAPFTGQDALMRLVRSQQAMVNAGGELARVHGRLSDISVAIIGGGDPCPTPAFGMDDLDSPQSAAELSPQSRAA